MGLIDRLRDWLRGLVGGSAEPDDEAGAAEPEEPHLDPENVTKARTADDTDGAARRLTELRRSRTGSATDGAEGADPDSEAETMPGGTGDGN